MCLRTEQTARQHKQACARRQSQEEGQVDDHCGRMSASSFLISVTGVAAQMLTFMCATLLLLLGFIEGDCACEHPANKVWLGAVDG